MGNILTNIFDFFLPRVCPCCNSKLLSDEECVCSSCFKNIRQANNDFLVSEYIRDFSTKNYISDFTSAFIFEKDKELQTLMHSLKYNKRFLIGEYLGRQLAEIRYDTLSKWDIDYIVPVPLHKLKLAERGYNQSYYVSKGLSKKLNIPVRHKFIKRRRFTKTQTNLSRQEREENLEDAFKVRSKTDLIKGKNILIVDDVITTGATMNECAKILISAGVDRVYAASVAIPELKDALI